jgi:membrane-associated two-gene conflict system component 1 (EACC1)
MSGHVEKADASGLVSVLLEVEPDPELDPEMTERLIRQLRAELAELDVESVELGAGGAVPAGAKAADPVTLGAIVVALSASGGVFTTVIETLRDWLGRSSRRHRIAVTIAGDTIELERATAEQQRELLEAFVRRHSGDG